MGYLIKIPYRNKKDSPFSPLKNYNSARSYSTFYSLSIIVQAGVRLILFFEAAKLLGPKEYSSWPLIQAIMSYSMVIGIGVMPALGLELSIYKGASKTDQYNLILSSATKFLILFWISILLFSGIVLISTIGSKSISYGCILAVAQSMIQLFIKIHRSELNFKKLFLSVSVSAVWLLFSGIILYFYPTLDILFLAFFLSLFLQWMIIFRQAVFKSAFQKSFFSSLQIVFSLQKLGIPLMISGILVSILFSMDRWFVNFYFDQLVLGQYAFAVFGALGIQLSVNAVGQVYYPIIAYGYGKHKSLVSQKKQIKEFIVFSSALSLFIVLSAWVLAPVIIDQFFPEYQKSEGALKWLVLGGLAMPFATISTIFLQIKKKLSLLICCQIGALALGCAILFIGCKTHVLTKVGISVAISYLCYGVCVGIAGFHTLNQEKVLESQ